MNNHISLLAFLTIISAFSLHAGTIKGKVTLGNGNSTLPGVLIHVLDKRLYSTTNEKGEFEISNIAKGIYGIEISYSGYKKEVVSDISIDGEDSVRDIFANLHERPFLLDETVVTATRTAKQLSDVPIPTSIISQKEINARHAVRLDDILSEQTGLSTVSFLGTGVQLQGLDPAYTLILIDGEPIIGRSGGTLDLKRVNVGNIEQIEIVKGPTSALYGSDALAGVINLITERPTKPLFASGSLRYGSFNAVDISTTGGLTGNDIGVSLLVHRSSADGHSVDPVKAYLTSPTFVNYTVAPALSFTPDDAVDVRLTARIFIENQHSPTETSLYEPALDESGLTDWSMSPKLTYKFSPSSRIAAKIYTARYKTETILSVNSTDSVVDRTLFSQGMNKLEAEFTSTIKESYIVTAGGGYAFESVEADRISGGKHSATTYFAYAQNEWIPSAGFDLIASYRFDAHSDYAVRFSPKISMMIRPNKRITFRALFGSGFKAPTFQQLYMDFTNPQVGYSVFGTVGFEEALDRAVKNGQVQSVLVDPNAIQGIRPENSTALDIGVDVEPVEQILVKVNLFRNNIKDLIETLPVALKNNGQYIYSYLNLNKVFTQGIEVELAYSPLPELTLSAGYQYLDAKDENVLENIRAGKIFKPTPSGARKVRESEYGGLLNRSPHTGLFKIFHSSRELGTSLTFRATFKSRYGFGDTNGNLMLDDDTEYVAGYGLFNGSITQIVLKGFSLFAGIENMFDKTNPQRIPSLAGRIFYGGISYQFN